MNGVHKNKATRVRKRIIKDEPIEKLPSETDRNETPPTESKILGLSPRGPSTLGMVIKRVEIT